VKTRKLKTRLLNKKTYQGRGEDQLIEGTTRPIQPALQGVACRNLLVILGVFARPESGRPRDASELEGLCFTASRTPQQSRVCTLLGLLDLWGGSPCCVLGSDSLLKGSGGLIRHANLVGTSSGRVDGDDPASPTIPFVALVTAAVAVVLATPADWGRDASCPSLVSSNADAFATVQLAPCQPRTPQGPFQLPPACRKE
jgi:hypothetical protein